MTSRQRLRLRQECNIVSGSHIWYKWVRTAIFRSGPYFAIWIGLSGVSRI